MNHNGLFDNDREEEGVALCGQPPFIWPEARTLAGLIGHKDNPPTRALFADADLIAALVVGAADHTVRWLRELMETGERRRVCVVLVLAPAGPTREEHLRVVDAMQRTDVTGAKTLDVRLLPVDDSFGPDCRRSVLPSTVIEGHNTRTGETVLSVGSAGDSGCDHVVPGSVNLVFRPDDALRDAWRRWFQYIFSSASPLTPETRQIPHLVPAEGDPEAARQWAAFQSACQPGAGECANRPSVDAETGEVVADPHGGRIVPWDEGQTALEPLAQVFQQVYAGGWLVTVDQETRIKPLTVPVKATLLGQQSERTVGALKHRQSFSLQVLDETVEKAIERCRKITDVVELLTCPLSQGNRWLPDTAKWLLEDEIRRRNAEGKKVLEEALNGPVEDFISSKQEAIRANLNTMYRELGQGSVVPDDKVRDVLAEIGSRLNSALCGRITPRAVYNRIAPPDLTHNAPDDNWRQPLSLLKHSACMLRESFTDAYFPRRLAGVSFSLDQIRAACDPFGDAILPAAHFGRAREELAQIEAICEENKTAKERVRAVWAIVRAVKSDGGRNAERGEPR